MSALRIRYETMQVKAHYESHKLLPEEALHLVVLTQIAFDDWAKRYPKDSWLPSTGYAMAKLYAELPGSDARDRARTLFTFVKSIAPQTSYGKRSVAALHQGLAIRPDPQWAATMRAERATPTPSPVPSPAPSASTSPAASASPSPSPTASPSGRPSTRPE